MTDSEAWFKSAGDWIAAEVRQFFRALAAFDPKAGEVTLFYLGDYLVKVLGRHLETASVWDARVRWLDNLFDRDADIEHPWRLSLTAQVAWQNRSDICGSYWAEPAEFDIRLDPATGSFVAYRFRFGDRRPLDAKEIRTEVRPKFDIVYPPPVRPTVPDDWLVEFYCGDPAEFSRTAPRTTRERMPYS